LYEFDYLALAAVFLPSNEFEFLMRKELLDISSEKERSAGIEWQEYWQEREKGRFQILAQKSMPVAGLFAAPPKKDVNAFKYCPVCLAEF
jgi:hypothetical protein